MLIILSIALMVLIIYLTVGWFIARHLKAMFSNTFDALGNNSWPMKVLAAILITLCVVFWPLALLFVTAVGFM